jgi:phospholipase/carboxylesterase
LAADGQSVRLSARVTAPTESPTLGLERLGLIAIGRDGLLYVPRTYRPEAPMPLLVLLHGAGGAAANFFGAWGTRAESHGLIVLAIDSRARTWDAVLGGFGPDVQFIDRALSATFRQCAVDPARIALGGFSDGASYALSLGLANGGLFRRIVAFSPGFISDAPAQGKPQIFVSHGTADPILPIRSTSRVLVPLLERDGYQVEYVEFEGGHGVPPEIAERAITWMLG